MMMLCRKFAKNEKNDHRLTVCELAEEVGISIGSFHEILTENLHMRRVATKYVPQLLTLEQKENRFVDPNFIKKIITGD